MPHSEDENTISVSPEPEGQALAVIAETLFLLNILILPGLAFIILSVLYFRHRHDDALLAVCHLRQTFYASILAGVMLILVNGIILLLGGYDSAYTWIIVILYFVTIHAAFIFLGSFGLTRAMNGKHYHYPLIRNVCNESVK